MGSQTDKKQSIKTLNHAIFFFLNLFKVILLKIVKHYDKTKISAHDYFIKNPSLSGRGLELNKNRPEAIMLFDH